MQHPGLYDVDHTHFYISSSLCYSYCIIPKKSCKIKRRKYFGSLYFWTLWHCDTRCPWQKEVSIHIHQFTPCQNVTHFSESSKQFINNTIHEHVQCAEGLRPQPFHLSRQQCSNWVSPYIFYIRPNDSFKEKLKHVAYTASLHF